ERSACLEIIHDELAGREDFAAMTARDHYQHDLVGWLEAADAMHDERIEHAPSRARLFNDAGNRLFRHARVMFERHLRHVVAIVDVAHHADKTGDRTYTRITGTQRSDLMTCVKVFSLNANRHSALRSRPINIHRILPSGHRRKESDFIAVVDR